MNHIPHISFFAFFSFPQLIFFPERLEGSDEVCQCMHVKYGHIADLPDPDPPMVPSYTTQTSLILELPQNPVAPLQGYSTYSGELLLPE